MIGEVQFTLLCLLYPVYLGTRRDRSVYFWTFSEAPPASALAFLSMDSKEAFHLPSFPITSPAAASPLHVFFVAAAKTLSRLDLSPGQEHSSEDLTLGRALELTQTPAQLFQVAHIPSIKQKILPLGTSIKMMCFPYPSRSKIPN